MEYDEDAIDSMPDDFDIESATEAFNDPDAIMAMLDQNNDGRITKEDLQLLLGKFGIKGMAAKVLAKFLFKSLDKNKNGKIDASDLVNAGDILWKLLDKKRNGH